MAASEFMDIIVRLRGDKATADVKKLDKEIDKLPRSVRIADKAFVGLGKSLKLMRGALSGVSTAIFSIQGLIATAGLGMLARSFTQAAATAEGYRTRLTTLLGSVEKGNELFQKMSEYASGVSFSYEEVMGAATQLTGVMKGGVEEVQKWIPLIGDLAAASGLDIQTATGQVIRMYSAGAASADLFRERGILAMLGFQAGVSTSARETREQLIKAWEDPLSKFRGASALLAKTWRGLLSMVGDSWFQFRTMVMESGIFDYMKAIVALMIDWLGDMRDSGALKEIGQQISNYLIAGIQKLIHFIFQVQEVWRGWLLIWNVLKGAYATFAPYILEGISVIAQALGGLAVGFQAVAEAFGMTGIAGKMKQIVSLAEDISGNALEQKKFWEDVRKEAAASVIELSKQTDTYGKADAIIQKINARLAKWKKQQEELSKIKRPKALDELGEAKLTVQLATELAKQKAHDQTVLLLMDIAHKKGVTSVEEYWTKRREITNAAYKKELELLKAQEQEAILEKKPDKIAQINGKIYALNEKLTRDLINLDRSKEADDKKIAASKLAIEKTLADAKLRAAAGGPSGLTATFQKELSDLQTKQDAETKLMTEAVTNRNATIEQENALHRAHELEQEKLLADQKKRLIDLTLNQTKEVLGFMGSAFGDMYEATGKKHKAWARAQRATNIAMAVITTYQSAIKAYDAALLLGPAGIYMAPIAAAAAVFAGMAKIAAMRAQPLATGGVVKGSSPTTISDNIPVSATAGEFMQPVSAVRKYGLDGMEAIRRGLVPPELLQRYNLTGLKVPSGLRLQSGGVVPSIPDTAQGPGGQVAGQPINIINILDPKEFDKYLWSPQGTNSIVNIISSNQDRIRRLQTS